jgi:hypothetical protein
MNAVFGQTAVWQINFEIWGPGKILPWHPPWLTRSFMPDSLSVI